jgi:hypothetical protein
MSARPESPAVTNRSGSGNFTFAAAAPESRDAAPTPPLLTAAAPLPSSRPPAQQLHASYGVYTASGAMSGIEVAADPEGRFVWALSGSSRQQLYRAGGQPAAKLNGETGPGQAHQARAPVGSERKQAEPGQPV